MKTDAELMEEFQLGDSEAFEKLVLRHQIGIFNFFMRMVCNRAEAEDLSQEVFLKVYLNAGKYVHTAKFTTYLYRIAKNCLIDAYRKRSRRGKTVSLDHEDENGNTLKDLFSTKDETSVQKLEKAERRQVIDQAIADLPDSQRMVFVLCEVQGLKYNEVADIVEVPLGTVKSRMHSAVLKLREMLKKEGIF